MCIKGSVNSASLFKLYSNSKKGIFCSSFFFSNATINYIYPYFLLLCIEKVVFILWVMNEINEESQCSKPPSQKQELNCNKSQIYVHKFMGQEDLGGFCIETLFQHKRENYDFQWGKIGKKTGQSAHLQSFHCGGADNFLKQFFLAKAYINTSFS